MRSWRNWQTRKTKDLVGNSMQVQSLSTAPKSGNYAKQTHICPIFLCICAVINLSEKMLINSFDKSFGAIVHSSIYNRIKSGKFLFYFRFSCIK